MIILNGEQLQVKCFSNNEVNVKDFEKRLKERGNIIELKYENDSDLLVLMFVKKRIDEFMLPCKLFIWYMPYSRMDRKIEGKIFALKYICEFINSLNFMDIIVMEPHSEVTIDCLKNSRAVYPVLDWLSIIKEEIGFTDNDYIVFPDEGAAKRYKNKVNGNICIWDKKRDESDRIVQMNHKCGEIPSGVNCIILDDICSSGKTIENVLNNLIRIGVNKIYVIVAHCEDYILGEHILYNELEKVEKMYTSKALMQGYNPKVKYMEVDINKYI
jgi:ribose-phosphate pyrophosphokinase